MGLLEPGAEGCAKARSRCLERVVCARLDQLSCPPAVWQAAGLFDVLEHIAQPARLLADPYFPKHKHISPELAGALRRYYDFAVRYGELIGPNAANEPDLAAEVPTGVWAIPRSTEEWLTVSLINFTGIVYSSWDQPHSTPVPQTNLTITIKSPRAFRRVWWASPDRDSITLSPATFTAQDDSVQATLPDLDIWSVLAFELDG